MTAVLWLTRMSTDECKQRGWRPPVFQIASDRRGEFPKIWLGYFLHFEEE